MEIVHITDLSLPALSPYARLTEAQLLNRLHPDEGLFICESEKVIRVALQAGAEPVSVLCEEKFIDTHVRPLFEERDLSVYTAQRSLLAGLTGYELSRGMLCAMRRPAPRSAEEVCRGARHVVVMDEVVNSTNTGAIFRAAAGLGMDAVLLTHSCCDPLVRRACRVSMGTVFQLPWAFFSAGCNYVDSLRQMGFTTVALALTDKSVPIYDAQLRGLDRLALILGTEGNGLADAVLQKADYVARIPMHSGVDSLNVAAAAAIAFYQLAQ